MIGTSNINKNNGVDDNNNKIQIDNKNETPIKNNNNLDVNNNNNLSQSGISKTGTYDSTTYTSVTSSRDTGYTTNTTTYDDESSSSSSSTSYDDDDDDYSDYTDSSDSFDNYVKERQALSRSQQQQLQELQDLKIQQQQKQQQQEKLELQHQQHQQQPCTNTTKTTTTTTSTTISKLTTLNDHQNDSIEYPKPVITPRAPIEIPKTSSFGLQPNSTIPHKKTKDDFDFIKTIGKGAYGKVKLVIEKDTQKIFAAKILNKKSVIKEKKAKYVNTEKTILDSLDHPNIVKLFYTFQDENNLYFILEYCPNGDLLASIKLAGCFSIKVAQFYAAEILIALEYLHNKQIAHRDLKPENILMGKDYHLKLSDFGSAKQLGTGKHSRSGSFCGTAEYVCPELLTEKSAGVQADIWSYGCLLYQLVSGKLPFKGFNEYQTFLLITKREFSYPDNFDPTCRDLIDQLLDLDPYNRLTIDEIKMHPFFNSIDWSNLPSQTPPPIVPMIPQSPFPSPNSSIKLKQRSLSVGSPGHSPLNCLSQPPIKPLNLLLSSNDNNTSETDKSNLLISSTFNLNNSLINSSANNKISNNTSSSSKNDNNDNSSSIIKPYSSTPCSTLLQSTPSPINLTSSSSISTGNLLLHNHNSGGGSCGSINYNSNKSNNNNNGNGNFNNHSMDNIKSHPMQRERAATATPSPTFLSNHHNQHQMLQKGLQQSFSSFDKALSSRGNNQYYYSPRILLKPTELVLMDREKKRQIREQQSHEQHQWVRFLLPNDEIIMACGLTEKRSGLISKKRQLIITDTPRIFYVDPSKMIQKGEIGVDNTLSSQQKSSKHFIINSKGRSRHFYDLDGQSKQWVDLINELNILTFK